MTALTCVPMTDAAGGGPGLPGPGSPEPTLDQVNIVVSDMERSVAFYRLLGLRDEPAPPDWGPHHHRMTAGVAGGAEVELDSQAFAPRWNAGHRAPEGAAAVVLGFALSSRAAVDATYERLVGAGYSSQQPPFDAFWGARYAVVEDPDGVPVGLMSPAEEAMRYPVEPPEAAPEPRL
jgi:catechol 2,3-dioxygenase-like lactoylglutathione lyase family enzyme